MFLQSSMIFKLIGLFIQKVRKYILSKQTVAKYKFNIKLHILCEYFKFNYFQMVIN